MLLWWEAAAESGGEELEERREERRPFFYPLLFAAGVFSSYLCREAIPVHHLNLAVPLQSVAECYPAVTSVIVCSATRDMVQALSAEVRSCLSHLEGALSGGMILPGGGAVEVHCIREVTARGGLPLVQPPSLLGWNWMASSAEEAWPEVCRAFAEGLRCYVVLLQAACDPSLSVMAAASATERRLEEEEEEEEEGREWLKGAVQVEGAECKRESWARAFELARATLHLHTPHH